MNAFVAYNLSMVGGVNRFVELQSPDGFSPKLEQLLNGRNWTLVASGSGHRRWTALSGVIGSARPDCKLTADVVGLQCHQDASNVLVAFGGGAVIDFAKLTAFQLGQHAGSFRPPSIIAVPTIAGSGSERTHFASVWTSEGKSSVEHPGLLPEGVLLVPEFAETVPYKVAATSALDALSHALEAIWNRNATPTSDALAVSAISDLLIGLNKLAKGTADRSVIAMLMVGSSYAGKAISITKTAIAHSMSYPLTAELGMPHGLATSFALAEIARFNMKEESRLDLIARAFECERERLPERLEELLRALGIGSAIRLPTLAALDSTKMPLTGSSRWANNIRPATELQAREMARAAVVALS